MDDERLGLVLSPLALYQRSETRLAAPCQQSTLNHLPSEALRLAHLESGGADMVRAAPLSRSRATAPATCSPPIARPAT
jgi:hypothetical protein